MPSRSALFVGTHIDDIELGGPGTIQVLRQDNIDVMGLALTSDSDKELAKRRIEAMKKSAEILGYTPIFGGIPSRELDERGATMSHMMLLNNVSLLLFLVIPKKTSIIHIK